jgi:peptidoglycan/LPS O-acetylase OafA/YrhL
MSRRLVSAVSLTLTIYAFAAWVYVALVALVAPSTLHLQLTHLASWPRTDTFGEMSFLVSLLSFATYSIARHPAPDTNRRSRRA